MNKKFYILNIIFAIILLVNVSVVSNIPSYAANHTATINITTSTETEIESGFSGFNAIFSNTGLSYTDDDLQTAVNAIKPGWIRFVAGTAADAYNWRTGSNENAWNRQFYSRPQRGYQFKFYEQVLTAKKLQKLIDFKDLIDNAGAKLIICLNTFTDSPESAGDLVEFCKNNNIKVAYWQLANEPFYWDEDPYVYLNGYDYIDKMKPFHDAIKAKDSNAKTAIMFSTDGGHTDFDIDIANYPAKWWDAISYHSYKPTGSNFIASMKSANGILNHGTNDLVDDYYIPMNWSTVPVLITEFNVNNRYLSKTLYSGIYAAEYINRMVSHSNVEYVGFHALNEHGFQTSDSHVEEVLDAYENGTTIDTTSMDFGIFDNAQGLALKILNQAVNNSTHIWDTTSTGGATVQISGYDGNDVPALHSQAYKGDDGKNYVVITNKSAETHDVTIQVDSSNVTAAMTKTYVTDQDPQSMNNIDNPTKLAIQTVSTSNPVVVPAYSVVRVEWDRTNSDVPVTPHLNSVKVDTAQATLDWQDTLTATSYKVKYGTSSGSYTTTINTGDVSSYTVTGLTNDTTYYFAVIAVNGNGESSISNEISKKISAPDIPSIKNIVAKDGKLTVNISSVDGATGYKVKYGTAAGNYTTSVDADNVGGYTINGLTNNTSYYVVVSAYNDYGESSNSSEVVSVPKALPMSPHNVHITTNSLNDAVVEWEPSYYVQFSDYFEDGNANDWTQVAGTWSVVDDGITNVYKVNQSSSQSVSLAGNSSWTDYDVEFYVKAETWNTQSGTMVGVVARATDDANNYQLIYRHDEQKVKIIKRVSGVNTVLAQKKLNNLYNDDQYYRFVFRVKGNSLEAYQGGSKIMTVTDSTYSSGKFGLVAKNQTAYFDKVNVEYKNTDETFNVTRSTSPFSGYQTIATEVTDNRYVDANLDKDTTYYYRITAVNAMGESVYPSNPATKGEVTLLYDTFEDKDKTKEVSWSVGQGTWNVVSNETEYALKSNDSTKVGKVYAGSSSWNDYSVETKLKIYDWNQSDSKIGLMARYTDVNNHYSIYYDNTDSKVKLVKRVSGTNTELDASTAQSITINNTYHTLKLVVNGEEIKGYLNDGLVVSATDSSLTSGYVGCYTSYQNAFYNYVKVKPLEMDEPVGYWKFDETSGTTAADSSDNNNSGTVYNGAIWSTSGKHNGALDFDGSDDYVGLPNIVNPASTDFTVMAWVKLDRSNGNSQIILQQEGSKGRSWLYRDSTSGALKSYLGNATTSSTGNMQTGIWYHVAVSYGSGTLKLYINGQQDGSASRTMESETSGMRVGRHKNPSTTNEEWDGLIDQVRVYNRTLTADEIDDIYTIGQ